MCSKFFILVLQSAFFVIVSPLCVGDRLQSVARRSTVSLLYEKAKQPFSKARQYTGDDCETDDDCKEPRTCQSTENDGGVCIDAKYLLCLTSDECLENDRCVTAQGQDGPTRVCISCKGDIDEYSATAVDEGNCICIAIDSLKNFDKSSLVFDTRQRASVLCDEYENCATPGHMVIYKTEPMSMTTYCSQETISCRRTVKFVNSPKMKLGLRVSSFKKDLEFTVFAAAKETRLEETVLRWVLSIGI